MKKALKLTNLLLLVVSLITFSCSKDDDNAIEISLQDLELTIDENPTVGQILGSVPTNANSNLSFSIASQTPTGALSINNAGELTVADETLFDFEINTTITATISADEAVNTSTVTININNVNELNTQNLTATVYENPTNGDTLGTVQATGDGTLSFSISSQTPAGAITVDANTGELTVANATLFDFETNPVITANIAVDNSGNIETVTATINLNDSHEVGEFKFGGVIFWVNAAGSEGLVCAVNDQSINATWGCQGTFISGTLETIGSGETNTQTIMAGCSTSGIAADIASSLSLNGYNDWFLPSRESLNQIYSNKTIIDATATANGGTAFPTTTAYYWSSSESNNNTAWAVYFVNGINAGLNKGASASFRVRAVRAWADF